MFEILEIFCFKALQNNKFTFHEFGFALSKNKSG